MGWSTAVRCLLLATARIKPRACYLRKLFSSTVQELRATTILLHSADNTKMIISSNAATRVALHRRKQRCNQEQGIESCRARGFTPPTTPMQSSAAMLPSVWLYTAKNN